MKTRRYTKVMGLALLTALAFAASPAAAQEAPAAAAQEGGAEEGAAQAEREPQTGPLAEELENYWAVDRDLPVIQQKLYTRDGRLGLGLYTGMMSSEPFYWYVPVGGRASYFFSDYLGVEVGGQFMDVEGVLTNDTEITGLLKDNRVGLDPDTDLEDRMKWRANATVVWNPLYGKWSLLNSKLSHFDFNLVLGAGVVQVLRPDKLRQEASDKIAPEAVFGGGFGFYLTQDWLLRADGRIYVYQGPETTANEGDFFGQLQVPAEFLIGVSYLF